MQNQSDSLAFQKAQAAFTDAMSLGTAYGYSMGGNPYNFGSMMLPPAGTPLQSTINTMGYAGAIPGYTGYNTGQTASYQQQLASQAAQAAGITGTYSAPVQSPYSPGTFVQVDPSQLPADFKAAGGSYALGYVMPNGQLQRVTTEQAQQMGYNPSNVQNIAYNQFQALSNAPPTSIPQQSLQSLQTYSGLNTQAQQNALAAAQATGMYTAPGQVQAPGYAKDGSSFYQQSPQMQQQYLNAYPDPASAMQAWTTDTNKAIDQSVIAAGGTPSQGVGGAGTPTETLAAQNQYFTQAQQLAQMYGQYYNPGAPGQAGQAGVNGPQAGQQTLGAQQQYFTEGLQTQQFQQQAAQQYLQLLSQLQGPQDYGQYLKVLGSTPGGIQQLVGAAAGQFVPGTGVTGTAPQSQTLQNLIGAATGYGGSGTGAGVAQSTNAPQGSNAPSQLPPGMGVSTGAPNTAGFTQTTQTGTPQAGMYQGNPNGGSAMMGSSYTGQLPGGQQQQQQSPYVQGMGGSGGTASQGGMNYQDFLAQAQGLPPPSQIAPQAFKNMLPSQQQMLGSMYSNVGYAPGDINAMFQASLPKYAAGSATGSFTLR